MFISSALQVLGSCSRKLDPMQGHATVGMCSTFGSGHDNFIGIRVVRFSKLFLDFKSVQWI